MEIDVLPWRYGKAVLKRNTAALIRTRNGGQCLVSSAGCVCHADPVGFKSYQLLFFSHGFVFSFSLMNRQKREELLCLFSVQ